MNFNEYLISTIRVANEEKEILDSLYTKTKLTPIELRAVKNSLQVLIENLIGKCKKILKYFGCPIVPQRGRDAIDFLYDVGAISDDRRYSFGGAIGFRNSLIHNYMQFDDAILYKILNEQKYIDLYDFLIEEPKYSQVIISRIENYTF